MRNRAWIVALVLSLALPAAAGAQRVVIGADLQRPANAPYGCETLPTTDAFGNRFFLGSGAATCTYLATGSVGNSAEVPQARGPGVATAVRVKAGPVTGPMQVTVMRATRSAVGFACCFHAGQSQVFTPAPNTVTQVGVLLPMRNDLNPAFGETVDYLGLTVLAPGVPIPAHEIGNPGDIRNPGALGFFPHLLPGAERADGAGIGGVVPLLQADFVPLCGRAAGAARARAAQAGRCLPALAPARVRRAGTRAALTLACNLGLPCTGTLRLQARRDGGPVLASGRVNLGSGARDTLRIRLTRAGRRALRRGSRAWLVARLDQPTGVSLTVRRRVTLRG